MAEYVSREKMMALFNKYHPRMATSVVDYWTELENLPTEDVAPVRHGWWSEEILRDPRGSWRMRGFRCSVCSGFCVGESRYCPNCGARMDGGKNV